MERSSWGKIAKSSPVEIPIARAMNKPVRFIEVFCLSRGCDSPAERGSIRFPSAQNNCDICPSKSGRISQGNLWSAIDRCRDNVCGCKVRIEFGDISRNGDESFFERNTTESGFHRTGQ